MPRRAARLCFILLALVIANGCQPAADSARPQPTLPIRTLVLTGGPGFENSSSTLILKVEIADDAAEHEQGLMFRQHLAQNHGMLFIWHEPGERIFWMKNTYVPLDLLFFHQGRLVATLAHAQPMDETPLNPGVLADWVLEVPAGFAATHNLLPTFNWHAKLQPAGGN